jgi:hypothetical protein
MVFIYLGLKEEDKWVVLILLSTKMKKGLSSQALQTRDSCLSVIGQPDLPIKQEAKMIQLFLIGINKEITDQ